jgi:hypothetical protein
MWSARGRREWSRTSIRTASGATANAAREGGRCSVAHASSRGQSLVGGGTTIWGPPCCGGCCGGAAGAARAASAAGAAGGATPAGCSECRACPTPHPKCCPISRSEVDSLHPDRPTAAERATVVRPSPGRWTFFPAIDGSRTLARGPQNVLPVPPWSSPHGGPVGSLPDHDGGLHQRTVLHRHRPMHRRSRRPKLHSLAQLSGELRHQPDVLHHADFARHRK